MPRRLEAALILAVSVAVTVSSQWPRGMPRWEEVPGVLCLLAGTALLAGWRRWPRVVAVAGPLLLLATLFTGPSPSAPVLVFLMAYFALVADAFEGALVLPAAVGCAAYVALLYTVTHDSSPGFLILTLPGYVAGTALRLRRRTAEDLAERSRELEHEQALFAELSVRNERARIAAELHDIVGHALSVMVVQASAGQRLVASSPEGARASLAAIADSARQGRADLQRLIDLLGGSETGPDDLTLVDELVRRAVRSGLDVTCRLEGDRDGVGADASHAAYRVVQEGLTNALRHAPGARVRVLLRRSDVQRTVLVRVDNDPAEQRGAGLTTGSGRGLQGLRERVLALGGAFSAGPLADGGWRVEARLKG